MAVPEGHRTPRACRGRVAGGQEGQLRAEAIRDGGLRLRSSIHSDIQHLLEEEIAEMIPRLQGDPQVAAICINSRTP